MVANKEIIARNEGRHQAEIKMLKELGVLAFVRKKIRELKKTGHKDARLVMPGLMTDGYPLGICWGFEKAQYTARFGRLTETRVRHEWICRIVHIVPNSYTRKVYFKGGLDFGVPIDECADVEKLNEAFQKAFESHDVVPLAYLGEGRKPRRFQFLRAVTE